MDYRTLQTESRGAVDIIRLNRPHRRNAVIEQMYLELQDALDRARSNGSAAWC